jgi:D-glycerate 3-kinase
MPLYRYMDKWIFLKAPSFDSVYQWRCQQEHKLKKRVGSKADTMSDHEIARFIQYYQRLTEHSLCTLDTFSDWVFELDNERKIIKSAHNAK